MSTHRFNIKFSLTSLFLVALVVFMTCVAVYAAKRCLAENRRANEWQAVAEHQALEILNLRVSAKMLAMRTLSETNKTQIKAP